MLDDALALDFQDFEDAVLHETARHAGAESIVTRNPDDFATASLAIYTPTELLSLLQ